MRPSTRPAEGPAGLEESRVHRRVGVKGALATLALFVALAVGHTWPLASAPGTLSRHDNGDAVLNEWAVAWVAHQLRADPLNLFNANIFYPEPNTLAFSEHLFVQGVMGAPLRWAGASTLLVHNILILTGFALTGWSMCLVMRYYTGDWSAAIVGGMLLAFNAHTLGRLAHLQALHVEFLPPAVLALDRLLRVPALWSAIRLSMLFVLQSLTSNYLLVFTAFGMAAAALVRAPEWLGRERRRVLGFLCVAASLAIVLLLPFLLPYREAQRMQGLTRSLAEASTYAATWRDYLSATGTLHFDLWSFRFWQGTGLFPGVAALVLAAATLRRGLAWRDRSARMWLAIGVTGVLLSFGTSVPGYGWLYQAMPLLQGIRASVRFGFLMLAAVAALAAFGLADLRARLATQPRRGALLAAAALALVTVEAARAPMGYVTAHRSPALFRFLADEPDAVVVELPLYAPSVIHRNAHYMLHSTVHWRPMLNGYSGFRPASYFRHYDELKAFPNDSAIAYLRALRVTHVVVHANLFAEVHGEQTLERIDETPGLRTMLRAGNMSVYSVDQDER